MNRKIKTLLLTLLAAFSLTLTACQGVSTSSSVSSSSSSSSSQGSSASSSVPSGDATTIVIAADATSSLTQYLGLTSLVTINATVTGDGKGNSLSWYVDGTKSNSQSSTLFEYYPTTAGSHAIQAKYGSAESNTITVTVGAPSFVEPTIEAIDNDTVQVTSDYGLSISVSNNAVATTSSYNLASKSYLIDLVNPMVQGSTYTFTFAKSGYSNITKNFTYDTRVLKVDNVSTTKSGLSEVVKANEDSSYTIVRPFASSDPDISYTLTMSHKNLESSNSASGSNISFVTSCAGAEACSTSTGWNQNQSSHTLITADTAIQRTYTVKYNTTVGIYTHTVTVEDAYTKLSKSFTIKINIVAATPTISLSTGVYYGDSGNSGAVTSGNYTENANLINTNDADGDGVYDNQIVAGADGKYVVTLPYVANKGTQLSFKIKAQYFTADTTLGDNTYRMMYAVTPQNPYISYLSGVTSNNIPPTRKVGDGTNLFSWNFASSLDIITNLYMDATTAAGEYTLVYSAGAYRSNLITTNTFSITIVIKKPTASLQETITYNGQEVKAQSDGSYVLYKPLTSGVTFTTAISATVSNYDSPLTSVSSSTEGLSGYFNSSSGAAKRFLIYSIAYGGPLGGVTNFSKKLAIEMGANLNSTGTVTDLTSTKSPQETYTQILDTDDETTFALDATAGGPVAQLISISSTTATGDHTITLTVGALTRNIVIRVQEASQQFLSTAAMTNKINAAQTWATSTAYTAGTILKDAANYYVVQTAHTSGVLADDLTANKLAQITFVPEVQIGGVTLTADKETGKYYVLGEGKTAVVGAMPNGFAAGTYAGTFEVKYNGTTATYTSSADTVLTLNADNTNNRTSGSFLLSGTNVLLDKAGEYQVTFTLGSAGKTITIVVIDAPSFNVISMSSGTQKATLFNGAYYFKATDTASMTINATLLPVNVSAADTKYAYVVATERMDSDVLDTGAESTKVAIITTSAGYVSNSFSISGIAKVASGSTVIGSATYIRKFTVTYRLYDKSSTLLGSSVFTIYIVA